MVGFACIGAEGFDVEGSFGVAIRMLSGIFLPEWNFECASLQTLASITLSLEALRTVNTLGLGAELIVERV